MNIIKKKLIDCIKKNPEGISLEQFIEICLFDKNGYLVVWDYDKGTEEERLGLFFDDHYGWEGRKHINKSI